MISILDIFLCLGIEQCRPSAEEITHGGSVIFVKGALEFEEFLWVTALSVESVCEICAVYLPEFNTIITTF